MTSPRQALTTAVSGSQIPIAWSGREAALRPTDSRSCLDSSSRSQHHASFEGLFLPPLWVRALVDVAAELGVPASALLTGSGVEPATLADPEIHISQRDELCIVSNALQMCPAPALGLRTGLRIKPWLHGVHGYAMLSAADLRQGLDVLVEYFSLALAGPCFGMDLRVEGETARLSWHDLAPPGRIKAFHTAAMVGLVDCTIRTLVSDIRATAIHLDFPAAGEADTYTELLECPVSFDCEAPEYRLAAAVLERPLLSANAEIGRVAKSHCNAFVRRDDSSEALLARARCTILRLPCDRRGLEQVAEALAMSPRTFRRRLQAEGTSFQQLLDEVRCQLATEYLASTDLPVSKVAELVGFYEPSNFRRAFKSWTGETPSAYRCRSSG